MKRLGRSLRLVVVALLALLAAGTGLAQDAAGMWPEHDPEEIDRLVQSAEGGDAEAQLHLALMYACGFGGMEQSATEALIWFRRSAEQGFAHAQSALGNAYAVGELAGVEQDHAEAARWCRLAAEQGDADGQWCLALLHGHGAGVDQDFAESVKWYRLAAEQGHGQAQGRLGDIYAYGEGGIRQDPVEADKWYRLAGQADIEVTVVAGQEFTSGREVGFHLLVLGNMYRDGIGLPRNDVAAHKWLDISERWTPNASGWSTETPDGPVPLADEIRTLAEGMTPEQVAEAKRAADAFLETYRDPSVGDHAFFPSFEHGDPRSLGSFQRAAEQGDAMAQARRGDMYASGEGGVLQDAVEADKWYRLAVQANLFDLLMLGERYRDGLGVPRNDVAAYKWLDIVERWDPDTSWSIGEDEVPLRQVIDRLAERMTPEQVAEAQRAADAFLETYRS